MRNGRTGRVRRVDPRIPSAPMQNAAYAVASPFRPQRLSWLNPEPAPQRQRARDESHHQHQAVGRKEQQYLARRAETQQGRQPAAGESARPDLQEGTRKDGGHDARATVKDIREWIPVAESNNTMNETSHATPVSAQLPFASEPPTRVSGCTSVSRMVGSTSAAIERRRGANASGSRTSTAI